MDETKISLNQSDGEIKDWRRHKKIQSTAPPQKVDATL